MKAIIIGAGIGGLTTAVALGRVGIETEVYERASVLAPAGFGLSLQGNAVAALRTLDIDLGLERLGAPVHSFNLKAPSGLHLRDLDFARVSQQYAGAPSYCLNRPDLQRALLAQAGDCRVHLGATLTSFKQDTDGVLAYFADGRTARGDLLIGADGIQSAVRAHLAGAEPPRYGGFMCWLATQSFEHPALPAGASNHYWGKGQRFGMHDVGHGRVYWWGTRNMPAGDEGAQGKAGLLRAFDGWAPEVREVIEATPESAILAVPAQDRIFLEQWGDGRVTLLGDAAHPMLPSLGQGAGMSVEDAVVLAHALCSTDDTTAAMRRYEDVRRDRTKAMVNGSRSLARIEQLESAVLRAVRTSYFRQAPRALLEGINKNALTFPPIAITPMHRQMGPLERWHWIADQVSPLNVIARARVTGNVTATALREGLDALQARHPLLSIAAVKATFVPAARCIPLRSGTGLDWLSEVNERELADPIKSTAGPLARATVLSEGTQHEVLLTLSHTIADNTAALSLLAEWLSIAAGESKPGEPMPARPAPQQLLPSRHRGLGGTARTLAMVVRGLRHRPRRLPATGPVPFRSRQSRLVNRTLGNEQFAALRSAAAQHGISVYDAVAAATVAAVADQPGTYAIGHPTPLRPELLVGNEEAGAYVTMVPTYTAYQTGMPIWPSAGDIGVQLARRINRGEHLSGLNFLGLMCPRNPETSQKAMAAMEKNGPGNICLYRAEATIPETIGSWRVSQAQVVCAASVSSYLMVNVSIGADYLGLNFSYPEGILTLDRVTAIADRLISRLQAAS